MLTKALSLALFAGATLASRFGHSATTFTDAEILPGEPFALMDLRPGQAIPVHLFRVQLGSIYLHLPFQYATCDKDDNPSYATFVLSEDGALSLYSTKGPKQQLYVDRSESGQGKLGYTTGDEDAPSAAERTGFAVNRFGNLKFNGEDFIKCPGGPNLAWSIWVNVDIYDPGDNWGCERFTPFVVKVPADQTNGCTYTPALGL